MAEVVFDQVMVFGDGTYAVGSFALATADREITILVGTSGCGKTTGTGSDGQGGTR